MCQTAPLNYKSEEPHTSLDLVSISQRYSLGLIITELPEVLITNELPVSESLEVALGDLHFSKLFLWVNLQ